MAVRIGELLLKEKLITPEQLQQALTQQKANGGKLGYNLVKMGFVKDEQITALLSKQYGVPSINLAQFKIDPTIVKLVPTETARKYQIIPLSRSGSTLTIAMTDPTNVFAMDDIKFMTGYNVEPVVASEVAITDAIEKYYPSGKGGAAPASRAQGKPGAPARSPAARSKWRAAASRSCRPRSAAAPTTSRSSRSCRRSAPRRWRRQGEDAPVVRCELERLALEVRGIAHRAHVDQRAGQERPHVLELHS